MEAMAQGSRLAGVAEGPITPEDEQQCRPSSHAQAKGTTRAVAVARASTGLTTHRPAGGRGRAWGATAREARPRVRDREPVCEPHDSTGEPGAGNRHAGFGERGEETCPEARRESAGRATDPLPATRLPSTLHEWCRYPKRAASSPSTNTAPAAQLPASPIPADEHDAGGLGDEAAVENPQSHAFNHILERPW